jgi:regulator of protease activity HflC (stomatin/prohibitin superfamily)
MSVPNYRSIDWRYTSLQLIGLTGVLIGALVWFSNASNVEAPAGYAAYVVTKPIFGQSRFHSVIIGPSSTGLHWRLHGELVSVTPYSYEEDFSGVSAVIAQDKLPLSVTAHILFRVRSGPSPVQGDYIRDYIERFGGIAEIHTPDQSVKESYNNYVRGPFRALLREQIARHDGLEANANIAQIGQGVENELKARLNNTPFEVLQVVIDNAQPPQVVLDQIAQKVAKTQELERKATEQSIAEATKNIQKATGEAQGELEFAIAQKKAAANQALNASLTPMLLQYLAITAMQGADRIYVPIGANGIPLVANLNLEGAPASTASRPKASPVSRPAP